MTTEQFQQLIQILGQVGTAAYNAAYLRALVDGGVGAFFFSIAAFAAFNITRRIILFITWRQHQEGEESLDYDSGVMSKAFTYCVGGLLTFVFCCIAVSDLIELLTSQYAALDWLARLVIRS